jgi:hypothetical protein
MGIGEPPVLIAAAAIANAVHDAWEYESTICRLRRKKCCGRCAQNGSNGVME